ncbi:MAG: hypothetical protein KA758_06855 [Acidimicrobiales bacterium]|jgi:hypothetical protein|nr:hypothetical protein [Acidimicrobiales bacterium]
MTDITYEITFTCGDTEWRPFDEHNATQALARMIAADPDDPTEAELADADECRVILANFWAEWRAKDTTP